MWSEQPKGPDYERAWRPIGRTLDFSSLQLETIGRSEVTLTVATSGHWAVKAAPALG